MLRFARVALVIALLAISAIPSLGGKNKYCDVCKNHTMCKYKGLGEKCKQPGGSGISKEEKNLIVNSHNKLRSRVALGQERRGKGGPQKKSADMMKITWDNSLAEVAQRWADQCDFGHDSCRDDPRWKVGQNVFWKNKYPNHKVNWSEAITAWYNEVDFFDPKSINSFIFDGATGHYTQLMWHDTQFVGCGRRDYGNSKLYVCNYGPAGNWIDEPIYKFGEPCSKCPAKASHCDKGLCSKVSKSRKRSNETEIDDYSMEYDSEEDLDDETMEEIEEIKNNLITLLKKNIKKAKWQNPCY